MPFPNIDGKHEYDAFFAPQDFIRYIQSRGEGPKFDFPEGMILCYQNVFLNHVLSQEETERVDGFGGNFYLLKSRGNKVGIIKLGIGPSPATTVMEEFIALGARRFLSIGTAGGLQAHLKTGDIIVCDKAI